MKGEKKMTEIEDNTVSEITTERIALTKEEAAEALGISRPTLDKLIKTDATFPAFKIGKRVLISMIELNKWATKQALNRV